jgi:hypothetical protein
MVFLEKILLFMYKGSVEYYNVAVFYPGLYCGVLNLFAFAFSLAGGIALLKKKYPTLSAVGIILVLVSGPAPPIAFGIDQYIWTNGLASAYHRYFFQQPH